MSELTEDELLHYGVLGMKWGVRKSSRNKSSAGETPRQRNRRLNAVTKKERKKTRAAEKAKQKEAAAKRAEAIDKARKSIRDGSALDDYYKAKSEYKANKQRLGSLKAKEILQQENQKYNEIFNLAQQPKTDAEAFGNAYVDALVTQQLRKG